MRVTDLLFTHDLVISCDGCNTSVQMTRAEAIERFGEDFPLANIRERGRCTKCGHTGAVTVVQYVGETGMGSSQAD